VDVGTIEIERLSFGPQPPDDRSGRIKVRASNRDVNYMALPLVLLP
jgi:hypothetical protein